MTAACDFFTVPTATFWNLFVFVVLSHDRRVIRHVAVTAHPMAEWNGRHILEAFPDGEAPRLPLRDNDGICGKGFEQLVRAAAIRQLRTPVRSPRCNPYVERVLGEYAEGYCNPARTHLSLGGNAPRPRAREPTPVMNPIAAPRLGGLRHRYVRAA